jgi:hypothetical protein
MTSTKTAKTPTYKGIVGVRELYTYVDPAPGKAATDRVPTQCYRCEGTGYTCFVWVHNGICFHCNGSGIHMAAASTLRKRAKKEAYLAEYADEIQAYHQEADRIAAEAAKAAEFAAAWDEAHAEQDRRNALVQGFLGQIGDKVVVDVTIQVAKYISGTYNRSSSMFIIAKTESGQIIKTFGSSESLFDLARGDQATFTGVVKAHETYQGQDQTVLFRVKAVKKEVVD